MKTASIPSLRVAPKLRDDAESVLQEGETLSSFVEESLRTQINRRRMQQEFVARGLASRDEARRTNAYVPAEQVIGKLETILAAHKKKAKARV